MSENAETTVIKHRNPRMILRAIQSAVAARYRDLKNKFGNIWSSDATKAARLESAVDLMINSRTAAEVRRGAKLIQQDDTPEEYETGTTQPRAGSRYSFITSLKTLAERIIDAVSTNSLSPIWGVTSSREAVLHNYDISAGVEPSKFIADINPESVRIGSRNIKLRNVQRIATRVCRILRDYPQTPEDRVQTRHEYKITNATTFDNLTRYYYKRYDYLSATGELKTKFAALGVYDTTHSRFERGVLAYTFESGRTYYPTIYCRASEAVAVTEDTFYNQTLYFMPSTTVVDRPNLFTRVIDTSKPAVVIDATGEMFDTLWEEHVGSEICLVDNLPCDEAKILLEAASTIISVASKYKDILGNSSPDTASERFTAFTADMAAYEALRNQIAGRLGNASTRIHIPSSPTHTYGNLRYTYDQTTISHVEVTDQDNVRPWDTYELAHKLTHIDYLGLVKEIKMISSSSYAYSGASSIKSYAGELFLPLIMLARLFVDLASLVDGFAPLKRQSADPGAGVDVDDVDSGGDSIPSDPSIPGSGWTYLGHVLNDWATRIRFSKSSDPKIKLAVVIWPRQDNTYVGYRLRSIENDGKLVSFRCTQPPDQKVLVSGSSYTVEGYYGKCVYETEPFVYTANRPIDVFLGSDTPYRYIEAGDPSLNGVLPTEGVFQKQGDRYLELDGLESKTLTSFDHQHNWYFVQSGSNLTKVTASTPTPSVKYYELTKDVYYIRRSLFESKYVQLYVMRVGPGDVPDPDYPGGGPDDPYADPDPGGGDDWPVGPPSVDPDPPEIPPDVDPDEWLWRFEYNKREIKLSTMSIRIHKDYVPVYFQIDPGDRHDSSEVTTYNWTNPSTEPVTGRWIYCKEGDKVIARRSATEDAEGYYTYVVDRIRNITPGDAIYVKTVEAPDIGFIRSYVKKPEFTEYKPTTNPRAYLVKTANGGEVTYSGSSDGVVGSNNKYLALLVAVDNSKQGNDDNVSFDYIAVADYASMAEEEDENGRLVITKIPAYGYMKSYTEADADKDKYYRSNGVYVLESVLDARNGSKDDGPYCKAFDDTSSEGTGWIPANHTGSGQNVFVLYDKTKTGKACASLLSDSESYTSSQNSNLIIETYNRAASRGMEPSADEMKALRGNNTSAKSYEIGSEDVSKMLNGSDFSGRCVFVRYTKMGNAYSNDERPEIDSNSEPFKFLIVDRDPTLNRLDNDPYTLANGWVLLYGETESGDRRVNNTEVVGATYNGRKAIGITASLLTDYHVPYSGDYEFCIRAVSGSRSRELSSSYASSATIAWTNIDQYLSYIPLVKTTDDPNSADTAKKIAGWKTRLISSVSANNSTSWTHNNDLGHSPHSIYNNGNVDCMVEDLNSALELVRDADSTAATTTTMNKLSNANEKKRPSGSGQIVVAKDYIIGPNYGTADPNVIATITAFEVELTTSSDMIYITLSDDAYTQLFGSSSSTTIPEGMVASGFKIYVRRINALRIAIPHVAFSTHRGDYVTKNFATQAPKATKATSGTTRFPQFSKMSANKNNPYLAGSQSLCSPKTRGKATLKAIVAAQGFVRGVWGMSFAYKDATYALRLSFSGAYTTQSYGTKSYRRYSVNPVPTVNVADNKITSDTVEGNPSYYISKDGEKSRAPRTSASLKKLDGIINALFCIEQTPGQSADNLKLCYLLPYYEFSEQFNDADDVAISRCQPPAQTTGTKDAAENKTCWKLKEVNEKSDSGATVLYRIYGSTYLRRRKKVTINDSNTDRAIYLNLDWNHSYLLEVDTNGGKITPNKSPFKEIKWPKNRRVCPSEGSKNKVQWTDKEDGTKGINMIKAADFYATNVVKRLVYDCFYSPSGTVYTILDLPYIASATKRGYDKSAYLVIPKLPKGVTLYITRLDDYDVDFMIREFTRSLGHATVSTSDDSEATLSDLEWDASDDDMETDLDADAASGDDPDDGT